MLKATIKRDPVTGLPVLCPETDAEVLTSEQVGDILSEFP
jgi:hypothetical protein